jgi:hypothetical protein
VLRSAASFLLRARTALSSSHTSSCLASTNARSCVFRPGVPLIWSLDFNGASDVLGAGATGRQRRRGAGRDGARERACGMACEAFMDKIGRRLRQAPWKQTLNQFEVLWGDSDQSRFRQGGLIRSKPTNGNHEGIGSRSAAVEKTRSNARTCSPGQGVYRSGLDPNKAVLGNRQTCYPSCASVNCATSGSSCKPVHCRRDELRATLLHIARCWSAPSRVKSVAEGIHE